MIAALFVLLLVIALFAVGAFTVHLLLIVAAVLLAVWLVGFAMRSGERAAWYRW